MQRVTIRQCPVCGTIRSHAASLAAKLKAARGRDVEVELVDGNRGELTMLVDGRVIAEKDFILASSQVSAKGGSTATFRRGDVVRLLSGGPKMTVTEVGSGDFLLSLREGDVVCEWFDGHGKRHRDQFSVDLLKLAETN